MKERHPKGLPVRLEILAQGPAPTLTEPIILWVRAPPPPKPKHQERMVTPIVSWKTIAESSAGPDGTIPMARVGDGNSSRPFTLKNLEAPGKFSSEGASAATTWSIEMSH